MIMKKPNQEITKKKNVLAIQILYNELKWIELNWINEEWKEKNNEIIQKNKKE